MFTSDYMEKEEMEIGLNGFESGTFDAVLGYMYTGYVEVRRSVAQNRPWSYACHGAG